MGEPYVNDEELVECIGAAFNHNAAVRYVREFREQFVKAERERVLAEVERVHTSLRRQHVNMEEMSDLIAKLRGETNG
jgi:hypothetical protein